MNTTALSMIALQFDSKLVVVVVVIGLMETKVNGIDFVA